MNKQENIKFAIKGRSNSPQEAIKLKGGQENSNPNQDIIGFLNNFGKQINSRKIKNVQFQQQISCLSKAYNEAQQKLLQTEKLLMNQSIYSDKLRSLVQILKQIINDSIDDDTTLVFIAQLQSQTETKHQIHSHLSQIKHLIDTKKIKNKATFSLTQLKKQLSKLEAEKRDLLQDMERVVIENQDLQQLNQKLSKQLEKYKQQHTRTCQAFQKHRQDTNLEKQSLSSNISQIKKQISKSSQQICEINLQNAILKQQKQALFKQLTVIKLQVLQFESIIISQKNRKSIESRHQSIDKVDQHFISSLFRTAKDKILKYQQKLKQITNKNLNQSFAKKQINIMKQFLSEQALVLFAQLQCEQKNCKKIQNLVMQLLQLAKLQKQRTQKLKQCEKKVWKYKVRLLKEDQSKNFQSQRETFNQTIDRFSKTINSENQQSKKHKKINNQFQSIQKKTKNSKSEYQSAIEKLSQFQV